METIVRRSDVQVPQNDQSLRDEQLEQEYKRNKSRNRRMVLQDSSKTKRNF